MSFRDKLQPVATSTPQSGGFRDKMKPVVTPSAQPATPEPEEQSFGSKLLQGAAKPFLKGFSSFAPMAETIAGVSQADIQKRNIEGRDFGAFGQNVRPLGAAFSEISSGDKTAGEATVDALKDTAGTILEVGSYGIGGGAAPKFLKNTLGGNVAKGLIQGARAGFVGGGAAGAGIELQNEESTVGSVAANAAGGAAIGTLGVVLPLPAAAVRGARAVTGPVQIMDRIARITPTQTRKFERMANGASPGQYLADRGIFGTQEEIVTKLGSRWQESKGVVDTELAKLGGEWKTDPVDTALTDLFAREQRVSSLGAPSRDLTRVEALVAKNDASGLTMTEINEVKRLYERNVKLDYIKSQQTESVARANNIDSAIRNWQIDKADKLGFTNLRELNKETQLAVQLGNDIFARVQGQQGNNAVGLTDAILVSGGTPESVVMLASKKFFGNQSIQAKIASLLSGAPKVGAPTATNRAAQTQNLLPEGSGERIINEGRDITLPQTTDQLMSPVERVRPGAEPIQGSSRPANQQSGIGELQRPSGNTTPEVAAAQGGENRFNRSPGTPMFSQVTPDPANAPPGKFLDSKNLPEATQNKQIALNVAKEELANDPAAVFTQMGGKQLRDGDTLGQIQATAQKAKEANPIASSMTTAEANSILSNQKAHNAKTLVAARLVKRADVDSMVTEAGFKDLREAGDAYSRYAAKKESVRVQEADLKAEIATTKSDNKNAAEVFSSNAEEVDVSDMFAPAPKKSLMDSIRSTLKDQTGAVKNPLGGRETSLQKVTRLNESSGNANTLSVKGERLIKDFLAHVDGTKTLPADEWKDLQSVILNFANKDRLKSKGGGNREIADELSEKYVKQIGGRNVAGSLELKKSS